MAPLLDVSPSEPRHNYLVGVPQRHWFLLAMKGLTAVKKLLMNIHILKRLCINIKSMLTCRNPRSLSFDLTNGEAVESCQVDVRKPEHLKQTLCKMLNLCLPVSLQELLMSPVSLQESFVALMYQSQP